MKLKFRLLILPILVFALAGCGKEDDDEIAGDVPTPTPTAPTEAPYHSLDMTTDDGKVTQLQKHKLGKGIPIVITGDGFVDRDIRDGKFREATNNTLDALFSVHPLKSLRDYFDVYEVTAVSYNDFSDLDAVMNSTNFSTAFNVDVTQSNGSGVTVTVFWVNSDGQDERKIVKYAEKAIGEDRINDATIVVLVNTDLGGGFCSYWSHVFTTEYRDAPTGCGIAYVPIYDMKQSYDYHISHYHFGRTLIHEFGHAFAKLADEYVWDEGKWDDPESAKWNLMLYQSSGYHRNVSLYSDVTKTYWADFAADSRYDFEKLGCYEGGDCQATGVYRASENSIMSESTWNHNNYNVIAREMFYKRCMNIAYGDSWTFDYEDFVKFDLDKAKAEYEEIQKLIKKLNYDDSASKRLAAPRVKDVVFARR